ncbi:MAG: bifunctional oligoribonuclease/PAP phosphatase NrnA [Bacteroidota bacterium]
MVKIYKQTKEKIATSKKIAIICHVNPDGDAIGSSLALYNLLYKTTADIKVITPNGFPEFLKWMPNAENITIASDNQELAENYILSSDLLIMVDFNAANRTNNLGSCIVKSPAYKILFDHHLEPENFVDIIHSDISVSSTCELVFDFIFHAYGAPLIDKSIAMCLYAGILTDTGNFSYSLSSKTFLAVSELLKTGIEPVIINQNIYDNYNESRIKILGHCLGNNLKVISECNAAYIYLTKDELLKFNHQDGDTEGIVNYPLSIKNINVSAIFIEKEDKIKISIRSKGSFNVNILAREYFNGGGHKNAAGGFLQLPLHEALLLFEKIVLINKKEIKHSISK